MPSQHHLKKTIRARMSETGENYTTARRAVLAGQDTQSAPAAVITKSYKYGSEAGMEGILTFADYAQFHIQDWEVALDCVERLVRYGEDENIDEHEGVHETYKLADRAGLVGQLRELHASDADLFDGRDGLLELLDSAERPFSGDTGGQDGTLIVSFVREGEGIGGDYDPSDPDDVELLRLDAVVVRGLDPLTEGGEQAASTCTQVPAEMPLADRRRLIDLLADAIIAELHGGRSLDRIIQRACWADETWVAGVTLPQF